MKLIRNFSFLVLPFAIFACSSAETKPTAPGPATTSSSSGGPGAAADGGGKPGKVGALTKPKTKVAPKSLGKYASKTPPSGAKSVGEKSSPKVASTVIPITSVEVYTFTFDYDEDGSDNEISWAHTEDGRTYLWSEGPIACADGLSDGTGAFVAEINEDGTGAYLFSVDACPQNDLFGCEFDAEGNDKVCGACSWNEAVIACVTETVPEGE